MQNQHTPPLGAGYVGFLDFFDNRALFRRFRPSTDLAFKMMGMAIAFTWGIILFGLHIPSDRLGMLSLAVLVSVFSTSGLGLLMGCIGLITRNVMFVNNTVYFLLLLFSGANVPLSDLPGWIRDASSFLPLSHGIAAARLIISEGAASGQVGILPLKELLVGTLYLLMGYSLFRRFEVRAKKTGTLEVM